MKSRSLRDLPPSIPRSFLGQIGGVFRWLPYITTMLVSFFWEAFRPSTWRPPVRDRLARQIVFTGVEAVPFTAMVGFFVGGAVFAQCLVWLRYTGQVEFLTELVSSVLIREAAPFLASFIVIAASGSAMTTELAGMKISGQVKLLEAQGINLFRFIAIPRMLGVGVAVLGLSIIFSATALLASAFGFMMTMNQFQGSFFSGVFDSLGGIDLIMLVGKSFLPGLAIGAICCYEGLRVSGATTEVPKAVSQAMLRSATMGVFIWGLFLVLALAMRS